MKALELFAGSRSFGTVAEYYGYDVFSVDWEKYEGIDLAIDIEEMHISDVPFVPDVVWASPDCTTYTIAAISHHRNGSEPKSEYAKKCDKVNQHFLKMIETWLTYNPNLVFFIENPRGMLRKMPWMQDFKRHTVWYCFDGKTKFLTREGFKTFKDTVDTEQSVLTKNGVWENGKVRKYGRQNIVSLFVRRGGVKKVIETTSNHKWFCKKRHQKGYGVVETKYLTNGLRLQYNALKFNLSAFNFKSEYFCRGFVYGDGYSVPPKSKIIKNGYSVCMVYGDKNNGEINNHFSKFGHKSFKTIKNGLDCTITTGLPYHWKNELPCLRSTDADSLVSWLMGYFAADGSVSKNSSQVTISSSVESNLQYVMDLCNIVGIGCYEITKYFRKGFGDKFSYIYSLTFMRADLDNIFFVNEKHSLNFKPIKGKQPVDWIVEKIEYTNREEDVYCVEVPENKSFTIEGNILTHNCQYGDNRAKPTDIWTNSKDWAPRRECHNGNPHCHHQSAPRGSKTGTQGRKGSYERSKIPSQLMEDIISSTVLKRGKIK